MCAIYTIINAIRALCPEMTMGASTALFQRLIRSLHTHTNDALSTIIIGTSRSLLWKLLAEAQSHVAKRFKVELEIRPKGRSVTENSLDAAWQHLAEILDERTVMILELGGCCAHCTVVYDVKPKTMLLLDSGDRRNLKRSHCTLRPSKTRYHLKLPAAIAVSRVWKD
jgi:hypothetical protein